MTKTEKRKITETMDAISRCELNNKIEMLDRRYGNDFYWEVKGIIDKLPSVYPKQKTGHWIDKEEKSAVCSCCNRNNLLYGDFCKWCGAKMEEELQWFDIA